MSGKELIRISILFLTACRWRLRCRVTAAVGVAMVVCVCSRACNEGLSEGPTSHIFTFKSLLRHYAKQTLIQVDVKYGHQCTYHKGRAAIRHYANQTAHPL